jgi:hypothetical protein
MNLREIEKLCEAATEGPWAWESVAEQSNEFVVGLACDKNGKAIEGEIPHGIDDDSGDFIDDEIIRRCEIGNNEGGQANFADAEFIAQSRTLIPDLIAKLREARAHILRAMQICKTIGYPYHATDERDFDRFLSTVTDEEVPLG